MRTQKIPYLTSAEENELKRLKAMSDEEVVGGEEFWAAKGTRSSYWVLGRRESGEIRIRIRGFLKIKKPIIFQVINTASKLGPHTQTDRGTCPGVGL
jgi:hypothetical protein